MKLPSLLPLLLALVASISLPARADEPADAHAADHLAQAAPPAPQGPVTRAVAVLHPTEGSTVEGTLTFTQEAGGIHIQGQLSGLTPGMHGFHVHQFGDCTAADGSSAGPHFNPGEPPHPHGAPEAGADMRHVGDLGNIQAGDDGTAAVDEVDPVISFAGDSNILGRGVIVHADPDDMTSQPAGNAGARLACGVIGATAAPAP